MAARKNLNHPEKVRARIKTSQLLNRLQDYVDGKVELSPSQAQTAQYLFSKVVANPAQQIETTGELTCRWKS